MRKVALIIIIVAFIAGGLYIAYVRSHREPGIQGPVLRTQFLDESFGCATVLRSPEGKVVVIDPASRHSTALIDMLRKQKVRQVAVIISHPSKERAVALTSLSNAINVSNVIRPELGPATEAWNKTLVRVQCKPIPERVLARGDVVKLSPKVRLETLNPVWENACGGDSSALVFRVRSGERSILFPTDIRRADEAEIIRSGQDLTSDVLAVGRNGRNESTSLEMLSLVRPQICVISAGRGSKNPSRNLLKQLDSRNTGAALYRTDQDGIIEIITDGHTIQVATGGGPM